MEAASRAEWKKIAALSNEQKRKRSRGPSRRLFGGAARSPRGWALVGGRILELGLAEADEALIVERDGAEVPGGLYSLWRLHVDRDRVVVLLLDLPGRVLDFFRQRREVGAAEVVHDALHDRDDHERDDLHRLVERELIREPVERVVVQHDDAVRLGAECLEALARDLRAAFHIEGEDRD